MEVGTVESIYLIQGYMGVGTVESIYIVGIELESEIVESTFVTFFCKDKRRFVGILTTCLISIYL